MKNICKAICAGLALMLMWIMPGTVRGQESEKQPTLNIGDKMPPLQVRQWLKGTPVTQFEKGKIYVVEFWATWCRPCNAAMPHLSALAHTYKDTVTFIGVDIHEQPSMTLPKLKAFVDSIGNRMDYSAAAEDSNFMVINWIRAAGMEGEGIPTTFIINAKGQLAWLGPPNDIDTVLRQIVNNSWDIPSALATQNLNRHLKYLDYEASTTLLRYAGNPAKLDYIGEPDSALAAIAGLVKKDPGLTYAPFIAHHTFSSLLKTNMQKALEYGKKVLVTPTYEPPAYDAVYNAVEFYSGKIFMPNEMYHLAAEACQKKIDWIPYPEIFNMFQLYFNMTNLYIRANDKASAVTALENALAWLKKEK